MLYSILTICLMIAVNCVSASYYPAPAQPSYYQQPSYTTAKPYYPPPTTYASYTTAKPYQEAYTTQAYKAAYQPAYTSAAYYQQPSYTTAYKPVYSTPAPYYTTAAPYYTTAYAAPPSYAPQTYTTSYKQPSYNAYETTPYYDNYNEEWYKYAFKYNINDYYGNEQTRSESSEKGLTRGSYSVNLPDGRKQIVSYEADQNGYRATITYEPAGPENSDPQNYVSTSAYNSVDGYESTTSYYAAPASYEQSYTTPTYSKY